MDNNTFLPAGSPLTRGEIKVLEDKLFEFLAKQPLNQVIKYDKMTEILGVPVQDIKTGKRIWLKVRNKLIKDGIFYGTISGIGIRREGNTGIISGVQECKSRMRNQAKKALRLLSIVDTKKLEDSQLSGFNRDMATMGMYNHMLSPSAQKQIEKSFEIKALDFSDTLKALGMLPPPKKTEPDSDTDK